MEDQGARELAARALVFIAQDPDRIGRFLALSGVGPGEIRSRSQDAVFLAGVLDHLLSDEEMLVDFADWADIDPVTVGTSRQRLPGAPVI